MRKIEVIAKAKTQYIPSGTIIGIGYDLLSALNDLDYEVGRILKDRDDGQKLFNLTNIEIIYEIKQNGTND